MKVSLNNADTSYKHTTYSNNNNNNNWTETAEWRTLKFLVLNKFTTVWEAENKTGKKAMKNA